MAGLRLLSLGSLTLRAGSQPASKDRDFWKVLLFHERDGLMMVKFMLKQYDLSLKTPVQLLSALLLDFVRFTHDLGEVCWPQHACKVVRPYPWRM